MQQVSHLFFLFFLLLRLVATRLPPHFLEIWASRVLENRQGWFFSIYHSISNILSHPQSITQFSPIVFPILNLLLILYPSPPISQKRERFPEPRKTSTRKKITDEFLETLFRRWSKLFFYIQPDRVLSDSSDRVSRVIFCCYYLFSR